MSTKFGSPRKEKVVLTGVNSGTLRDSDDTDLVFSGSGWDTTPFSVLVLRFCSMVSSVLSSIDFSSAFCVELPP